MRLLVSVLMLFSLVPAGNAQQSGRAKDQVAFAAARGTADPEQRIAAFRQFLQQFPESSYKERALTLSLETYLASFPEKTTEIHELATAEINAAPAGFERWFAQAQVANLLASAGTTGADLADAKRWAEEAVASTNEEAYRRAMTTAQARYKLPPLTARQIREGYAKDRAFFLAALANVELRGEETDAAEHTLTEAYRLAPLLNEVNSLRGQVAMRKHRDGEALEDFERAEATGELKDPWRAEMLRLYAAKGNGGEAGLEQQIDAVYNKLYHALFTLPPRTLPAGGHTALLELYTGSGCEPCVAPDLAVESLLTSYSRQDLVVMEFDEHIPRPDPLANPDTIARAVMYRVGTTPEAFLDGEPLPVLGAGRKDVQNVVVGFADAIEQRAAEPTGVQITLAVARDTDGKIAARATVSRLPPVAGGSEGNDANGTNVGITRAALHFALVEDHVRYSGENGVRFHRMVVRAVENAPGPNLSLEAGAKTVREMVFDPAAIRQHLLAYLNDYEKANDRYGEVHFLRKDIPIQDTGLAVAAWMEDPATHQILQAVYTPVQAGS